MKRIGLVVMVLAVAPPLSAGEKPWIELGNSLTPWRGKTAGWVFADKVELDAKNPKKLTFVPGKAILVNGPGKAPNLVSQEVWGDQEVHVEFLIAKGSNSGVKLHGHYEIQIIDSAGVKRPLTGDDCGGVYPRAELKPKYHHIDKGIAPRSNAARAAGEWQSLDIIFQAPRFDAAGKKSANAKLVKVALNGTVIHDNVELLTPTGNLWRNAEMAKGPLLLQGDHGPVAFRNVRIRPWAGNARK